MSIVIDASVFVSASSTNEREHATSRAFLDSVEASAEQVYCPTIVLPECAGAVARVHQDSVAGQQLTSLVETFAHMHLVSVDVGLARRAAELASVQRLRGTDAVYVAVSAEFRAALITWDQEMLERGRSVTTVLTPVQWLGAAAQRPPG